MPVTVPPVRFSNVAPAACECGEYRQYVKGSFQRRLTAASPWVVLPHLLRNGVPVGELQPVRQQFVTAQALVTAFRGAPRLAPKRFRRDVDRRLSQDVLPRA